MSGKLPKSGKEVAKQTWAKTDLRYWEAAVFKPKFSRISEAGTEFPGEVGKTVRETRHYSVRISHQGDRHTIPLGLANKTDAARKAKDIYLSLISVGWPETLEKFHPHHINRQQIAASPEEVSIGRYIESVEPVAGVAPRSLAGYISSLRMIAANIAGVKSTASKFDYKKGGRDAWVKKVDAVPLASLTTTAIEQWKQRFVKKRKGNPVEERKARNSANSFIRQARSLFAPKIVKLLDGTQNLPEPLPFHEVTLFPRSSMRYATGDAAMHRVAALESIADAGTARIRRHRGDRVARFRPRHDSCRRVQPRERLHRLKSQTPFRQPVSMRNMVGLTAVSGDSKQATGWFVWTPAGWRR